MKPLLINAKQMRELLSITSETVSCETDFPKPVKLDTRRVLWRYKDVKKWIKNLEQRK